MGDVVAERCKQSGVVLLGCVEQVASDHDSVDRLDNLTQLGFEERLVLGGIGRAEVKIREME